MFVSRRAGRSAREAAVGRMVNALGSPIPRLGLCLRSSDSAAPPGRINSDRDGYFSLDCQREGELSIQTNFEPVRTVTGFRLSARENELGERALDWVDPAIELRITVEQGNPVAGADISVSWSLWDSSLYRRSSRRTSSAGDDAFAVSGLGPGIRALGVCASGFEGAWPEHDLFTDGRDLLVELAGEDP